MRLEHLRQSMSNRGIDGLLVTGSDNRRYLSAFTGSAGVLIITPARQAIATDSRYYQQVRMESPAYTLIETGYDFDARLPESLVDMELDGKMVGFESSHLPVDRYQRWQSLLPAGTELVATRDLVDDLRLRKDDNELTAIRRAISIADESLAHIFGWLRPGITERQVAWELESYMRQHGTDGIAFDIIVAAGPNGALPHATPGERAIEAGEPIIMDLGCTVDGYRSDVTRTVCLGTPRDERYLDLWRLVDKALETAQKGLFPDIGSVQGDGLAREIIDQAGYGAYFGHSLGHGVGLAIHERPRLSYAAAETIPVRSVFTVEPGVYIPDWGGIRLENVVLMTEAGAEVLTQADKQPVL